jgi:glutathione S-transferase
VFPGAGRNAESLVDIARIETIWAEALAASGGLYLFGGDFGAADAMYAPVVGRFLTYGPELSEVSIAYCNAVRSHRLVDEWYRGAADEPDEWKLAKYEG